MWLGTFRICFFLVPLRNLTMPDRWKNDTLPVLLFQREQHPKKSCSSISSGDRCIPGWRHRPLSMSRLFHPSGQEENHHRPRLQKTPWVQMVSRRAFSTGSLAFLIPAGGTRRARAMTALTCSQAPVSHRHRCRFRALSATRGGDTSTPGRPLLTPPLPPSLSGARATATGEGMAVTADLILCQQHSALRGMIAGTETNKPSSATPTAA